MKCSPIKVWAKPNGAADEECEIGCNNGACKAVGASKWVKMEKPLQMIAQREPVK